MKRTISIVLLLLFMMSFSIGDTTPAMAAGGVASLHMNGGTGYIFDFVFQLTSGAPNQTITIPGNSTVPAIYSPSGSSLAINDQLIYVVVKDSTGAPIGIILPSAIGHRSDTNAVLQADGSMGANGQMVGNTGTINFWFNGFSAGGTQPGTSYIMANKVWLNADGTTFTGTPPALSFTLTGTTTVGSINVGSIPMLSDVPVLVLDGNYTITEPNISGFRLVSITSSTMQTNLPGRSASATTNSTINANYSATFTNQAIPISTNIYLDGAKMGNNIPAGITSVPADIFSFTATDKATGVIVATGTNTISGSIYSGTTTMGINFTPIEYTAADVGQHTLIIQEVGTIDPSWVIDITTQVEVTVNVSLSGNNVVANWTSLAPILFHNYNNARGSFIPGGSGEITKEAAGGSIEDDQFTFAVLDSAGNVVSTGLSTATADGTYSPIDFTPITYNNIGTYTYTVVETSPNVNGWRLMNPGPYNMTVVVSGDPSPADTPLTVAVTYSPNPIRFINVYEATGFLSLSAQKTAVNGTLRANQFQFAVVDQNGNTITTGTNDANGNINFGTIEYTSYTPGDVGFHRYSIIETSTSAGGWTTSSVTYPLLVSVIDNGNGRMTVTPFNILRSAPIFTNVYGSTGSVVLNATKQQNGGLPLITGQFEFAVQDEFGLTVATGVNNAAGVITFTPINYTNADVGVHNYTILETSQGGGGWTPSSVVYNVSVGVVDNGDGTITATPTYPTGGVVFINTYNSFGSIALSGNKAATGSPLTANTFTFAVMDENGIVVSTGTNDAAGNILFSAIPYTDNDVGVHNYTIVEKNAGAINWQIDGTVFNVSINVIDNGNGTFSIVPTYPPGGVTFTNTFISPPAGSLTIAKTFNGLPSGLNAFNQTLISPITFLVVGQNSANAQIYRQTIPFNRTNFTYNQITQSFECTLGNLPLGTYSVFESGGHISGYELSLNVPQPSVSLVTSGVKFNIANNYTQSPVAVTPVQHPALTVNKVFHGLTPAERPADFRINITGPGGFSQSLNLNQAISGSSGTFTNLTAGTYTINEVNNSISGYRLSISVNNKPVTLPFTVEVTSGYIMVTIDNYYRAPTPAPAPPTGINFNIVIPIVLITLAAACIVGAEIFRRHKKKKK